MCPSSGQLAEYLIDRTTGTNIGDLTSNGGLAAAFDGVTSQNTVSSAAKVGSGGYVGKSLQTPSAISRAVAYGANNNGFIVGSNVAATLQLYGKVGSAPSSRTDGVLLGQINFTDTSNESAGREIISTDQTTVFDHVWLNVSKDGSDTSTTTCAELQIYGMH